MDGSFQRRLKYRSRCAIPNCVNQLNQSEQRSYFRFPKDEALCRKWVMACGAKFEDMTAQQLFARYRICSEHFEDRMFVDGSRNKRLKDAVPTIFNQSNVPRRVRGKPKRRGDELQESQHRAKKMKLDPDAGTNEYVGLSNKLASEAVKFQAGGSWCAVKNCHNRTIVTKDIPATAHIMYHNLPTDPDLRERWLASCGRDRNWKSSSAVVCSEHFTPDDYDSFGPKSKQKLGVKRLKKTAIPTQKLDDDTTENTDTTFRWPVIDKVYAQWKEHSSPVPSEDSSPKKSISTAYIYQLKKDDLLLKLKAAGVHASARDNVEHLRKMLLYTVKGIKQDPGVSPGNIITHQEDNSFEPVEIKQEVEDPSFTANVTGTKPCVVNLSWNNILARKDSEEQLKMIRKQMEAVEEGGTQDIGQEDVSPMRKQTSAGHKRSLSAKKRRRGVYREVQMASPAVTRESQNASPAVRRESQNASPAVRREGQKANASPAVKSETQNASPPVRRESQKAKASPIRKERPNTSPAVRRKSQNTSHVVRRESQNTNPAVKRESQNAASPVVRRESQSASPAVRKESQTVRASSAVKMESQNASPAVRKESQTVRASPAVKIESLNAASFVVRRESRNTSPAVKRESQSASPAVKNENQNASPAVRRESQKARASPAVRRESQPRESKDARPAIRKASPAVGKEGPVVRKAGRPARKESTAARKESPAIKRGRKSVEEKPDTLGASMTRSASKILSSPKQLDVCDQDTLETDHSEEEVSDKSIGASKVELGGPFLCVNLGKPVEQGVHFQTSRTRPVAKTAFRKRRFGSLRYRHRRGISARRGVSNIPPTRGKPGIPTIRVKPHSMLSSRTTTDSPQPFLDEQPADEWQEDFQMEHDSIEDSMASENVASQTTTDSNRNDSDVMPNNTFGESTDGSDHDSRDMFQDDVAGSTTDEAENEETKKEDQETGPASKNTIFELEPKEPVVVERRQKARRGGGSATPVRRTGRVPVKKKFLGEYESPTKRDRKSFAAKTFPASESLMLSPLSPPLTLSPTPSSKNTHSAAFATVLQLPVKPAASTPRLIASAKTSSVVPVKAAALAKTPSLTVKPIASTKTPSLTVTPIVPTKTPSLAVAPTKTPSLTVKSITPPRTPSLTVKSIAPPKTPSLTVKPIAPTKTPSLAVKPTVPTKTQVLSVKPIGPVKMPALVPFKAAAPVKPTPALAAKSTPVAKTSPSAARSTAAVTRAPSTPVRSSAAPVKAPALVAERPPAVVERCFVCDKLARDGVSVHKLTGSSKIHIHEKLDKILGVDKLTLKLEDDGVLCSRCFLLLNYVDRIEVELGMLNKAILNCMRPKCDDKRTVVQPRRQAQPQPQPDTNNELPSIPEVTPEDAAPPEKPPPLPAKHVCRICRFKTPYQSLMIFHLRQHLKVNSYRCDFCNGQLEPSEAERCMKENQLKKQSRAGFTLIDGQYV